MTTEIDELVTHGFLDLAHSVALTPTTERPKRLRPVMTPSVRLHYVTAGDGPLVVLLHGFPEFWYSWRHQITSLVEAGFRVVAPDQRGYNLSEKPWSVPAYRPHVLARDVAELIDSFGGRAHAVVGHDFGGPIAWWFAHRYGDSIEKLALINAPHPRRYFRELRKPAQLRKAWYAAMFQLPRLPEYLLGRNDFDFMRRSIRANRTPRGSLGRAIEERYVESWKAGSITSMLNYYRATFREALPRRAPTYGAKQRPFEKPVLVIWGDRDAAMTPDQAEQRDEWSPDVQVVHLPGVGHWSNEDAPEEVNEALLKFL